MASTRSPGRCSTTGPTVAYGTHASSVTTRGGCGWVVDVVGATVVGGRAGGRRRRWRGCRGGAATGSGRGREVVDDDVVDVSARPVTDLDGRDIGGAAASRDEHEAEHEEASDGPTPTV